MSFAEHHHLPRLDRSRYQHFAAVHWTMRVEPVEPGWLTARFHDGFREVLLHACHRERLLSPVYCLMPDHLHLLCIGLSTRSDQLNAVKFLRTHLNRLLGGMTTTGRDHVREPSESISRVWKLQSQAHDHVLREEERQQDALSHIGFYILANPVRAHLVEAEADWPFSGAMLPGYPLLDPVDEDYWQTFWRVHQQFRAESECTDGTHPAHSTLGRA